MGRRQLLLTAAVAVSFSLLNVGASNSASAESGQCSQGDLRAGLCPPPAVSGAVNGGGVDLSAGFDTVSGGGAPSGDPSVGGGGQAGADGPPGPGTIVRDWFTINCVSGTPCDPNLIVGVSDLVNFRPAAPTQQMEPRGWSVVGLPTNFIASAAVHSRSGVLLGFPAEVRFTPVDFRWDFGDGQGRESSDGGATWAALNLPEFSDTPTSHTFTGAGRYSISLSVVYSAEYRFAGIPWRAVRGTLSVPTSPIGAVIAEAHTVLVNRGCAGNAAGAGC
jgi:hypothetical protein